MPPLEAWEKVWIDREVYSQDLHAYINCTTCHAGEAVDDMEAAHAGMILDPAADPEATCGTCHTNIAPHAATSLHTTLEGYDTAIYPRSDPVHFETLEHMESYHCAECHASCGDCHVAQPNSVGGGLLDSHTYVGEPPMSQTCTACHGSRVKNEYYGLNEGLPGDVHLRQARLACNDCHTGEEMHGLGVYGEQTHRYDERSAFTCEDCHSEQVGVGSGVLEHEIHGTEILSCQACHSVAYTNCVNCHVDRTEDDVPYYTVEEHFTAFYLGKNPLRSNERPYRYVPLRHVPIDIDSFDAYGANLLSNFLATPTWVYATPHNIQLRTPQTESCLSCHFNDDVFLTLDKLDPAERGGANLDIIVESAPDIPDGFEDLLLEQERPEPAATPDEADEAAPADDAAGADDAGAGDDSFWGGGADDSADGGEASDSDSGDDAFWGGGGDDAADDSGDDEAFWGDGSGADGDADSDTESDGAGGDDDAAGDTDADAETDEGFWGGTG